MSICVVLFKEAEKAIELKENLQKVLKGLIKVQLIKPALPQKNEGSNNLVNTQESEEEIHSKNIDDIKLLNPKLARQIRQKTMAFWLMPFGFISGLAFTKMTGLKTFTNLGFDPIAEPLIASFLGMGSGLIGSYVASGTVNPDINDDIGTIRKLNKEGLWLLLLETPQEIELPWETIKQSNNQKIISLNNN
tara:strand:+ start:177 stop:749 length:573 start_codon:yes stop_codon:yes gene_type:complete